MAESGVSETMVSQVSQKPESSRWDFLKKGLSGIKNRISRKSVTSEQPTHPSGAIKVAEGSNNEVEIQKNKILEQNAAKIGVDLRLYEDFISFLKDPSRTTSRELAQKAEQALNAGDIEMINTLAYIMQANYKNEIYRRRTESLNDHGVRFGGEFSLKSKAKRVGLTEVERKTLEEIEFDKGELGVKVSLVRALASRTSAYIQQEKGRRSVGEFMDIGLALSGKKDVLMKDKVEVEKTTADSAEQYIKEHA